MFKPVMEPLFQKLAQALAAGGEPGSRNSSFVAELVWPGGGPVPVFRPSGGFDRVANEWGYIVVNRQRWATVKSAVEGQARDAQATLKKCEVHEDTLAAIANAGMVEVVVHGGAVARGFPWEFLLAAATRAFRAGRPLTVVRQLPTGREPIVGPPLSALYVQSAPGPLADLYSFESEQALVRASLPAECKLEPLFNPTVEELATAVKDLRPELVHLAGFDAHQAARLFPSGDPWTAQDGYMLRDERGGAIAADGATLASALTRDDVRPMLVAFSVWNSGRVLAPAVLDAGANAALAFHDTFDDTLAEGFCSAFYQAWKQNGWDLAVAFVQAWTTIRRTGPSLLGSGVTLWGAMPLLTPEKAATLRAAGQPPAGRAGTGGLGAAPPVLTPGAPPPQQALIQDLDPDTMTPGDIAATLKVTIDPLVELNYSLLHNHRPLFRQFKITQLKPGNILDLTVVVDLFSGGGSWPFRTAVTMDTNPADLRRKIHVALTSSLARSVREAVNTSLLVEVTWKRHVLWSSTTPVRLLPADQWRDNDSDRVWLPSFVLPRDPAVTRLVDLAQRYVRVLRDDPKLGFDGYQSVDEDREDPSEEVDLQVQAIWAAILHEWRLGYINPPPSYGHGLDSQRLRTPSMVVDQHAGTCIDLSLLFAAALELVDIYPVIFLLQGHAFPGYWRSDAAHQEFVKAAGASESGASADESDRTPWIVASYAEVTRHVNEGNLVPIETVSLTAYSGFWAAVDEGHENLADPAEFHSMVDILMARQKRVTPLPIVEAV
jgi:hypothetical protein